MQHSVVYENLYLWNKHQLRGGAFSSAVENGDVHVQYLKTQTLTSENMGSFLAKSTTRVMAGVMILVNSLKASRSTLSLSDVGAGDCPMSSGWKTNQNRVKKNLTNVPDEKNLTLRLFGHCRQLSNPDRPLCVTTLVARQHVFFEPRHSNTIGTMKKRFSKKKLSDRQ